MKPIHTQIMELDTFSYKYLYVAAGDADNSSNKEESPVLVKQTILNPPNFLLIVPKFNVSMNKPFRGLNSTSLNDVDYQDLLPREEDSQLEAFSESDDEELGIPGGYSSVATAVDANKPNATSTSTNTTAGTPSNTLFATTAPSRKTMPVKVIVKSKSILINNVDFPVGAEIRSCTVLKGVATSDSTVEEDTLIISLKTGFLLLIRLFYVPRQYRDSDYHLQTEQEVHHEGNSIFKPFVMQWWDTSSQLAIPTLESSGHKLHAHTSGLTVVSTSASGVFRLYNTHFTRSGVSLKKHFNVEVDRLILHSCFAEPVQAENHVMFLTLQFTEFKRLALTLFQWSTLDGLAFSKSTLPLDNTFKLPIFIVSLAENCSFLFVSENELVVVTVNNIVSADYNFRTIPAPWKGKAFPTTHYRPSERVVQFAGDEILIAMDIGVIYSVVISKDSHCILPILRVADPISVFSLETAKNGYNLIYGSDTGCNKDLILDIISEEDSRSIEDPTSMNYTPARLVRDYKKWAPLLDVQFVSKTSNRSSPTSKNISSPEIFGISGTGRKTKFTNIKTGYMAKRKSASYEKLRKVERITHAIFEGKSYVFCSKTFETLLLEYQPDSKEVFVEIETPTELPVFLNSELSLFISTIKHVDGDFIFQVTPSCMLLTNLSDLQITFRVDGLDSSKSILMCDLYGGFFVVVTESTKLSNITLDVFSVSSEFDPLLDFEASGFIRLVSTMILPFQPSVVKFAQFLSGLHVVVGDFEGNVYLYRAGDLVLVLSENLPALNKVPSLLISDTLIPHEIVQVDQDLFIGTKDGYYIHVEIGSGFVVRSFIKLSDVSVHLQVSRDPRLLFVHSRQLYLCNFYESPFPSRVHFDEVYERSIMAMAILPGVNNLGDPRHSFAFIRDDGLMAGSVFTFREPTIRQITVGDNAKKLLYLAHNGLFAILCKSKSSRNRIRFVDRRLFKVSQHTEIAKGGGEKSSEDQEKTSIFAKNEFPECIAVWSVERNGRISKKLLVGSSIEDRGTFKVLDVVKRADEPLRMVELTSFELSTPITNVVQVRDDILFTSGKTIYVTTYDADEKRLKSVQPLFKLVSDITHLTLEGGGRLLVTTKKDSIFQFEYAEGCLMCVASDPLPNSFVNQAPLGAKYVAGDKLHSSISIIDQPGFTSRVSYQMSMIPRVYPYVNEANDTVLCVGVNGEVVAIRTVPRNGEELARLRENLGVSYTNHLEILERPFENRVSGMGLLSLNKPRFDFRCNKSVLVDYDLDDLSRVCDMNIFL